MSEKVFLTYRQQVNHLKSKSLGVSKTQIPMRVLKRENYYNVINGYKELFIAIPETTTTIEKYKKGANFNELYALYKFDCELRYIFLKRILRIENTIKSIIAYNFSEKYGHKNYLDPSNFDFQQGNANKISKINKMILVINKNIKDQEDKNGVIKHYKMKHNYIPLWVLMNILTIGNINYFYSLMKQSDRQKIAKQFNVLDSELTPIIGIITQARNKCAHDERFYDFKSFLSLPNNKIHSFLSISKNANGYVYGKSDFFSIVIILKLFLSKSEFRKVVFDIKKSIKALSNELSSINIIEVTTKMCLPNNWIDILKI